MIDVKGMFNASIDTSNLEQPKVYKNAQFSLAYDTPYGEAKFWINNDFMNATYMGKSYVISIPVAMFKEMNLMVDSVNTELVGFVSPTQLGDKRVIFDSNRATEQLVDELNNSENTELQTSGVVQRVSKFINTSDELIDKGTFVGIVSAAGELSLNSDEAKSELNDIVSDKKFGKVLSQPISDLVMLLPKLQDDLSKSGLFDVFLDGDAVFKEAK